AVDSLESTRPIEYPVHSPADADGMFDVLTYQKGASVLRMLQQFLGDDGFRAGIRLYLKSREYGNAETTDLWDAIEAATGTAGRRGGRRPHRRRPRLLPRALLACVARGAAPEGDAAGARRAGPARRRHVGRGARRRHRGDGVARPPARLRRRDRLRGVGHGHR